MNQVRHNDNVIPNTAVHHLTDTQLKYIALRAEGKSRGEAAKLANYSGAPAQIEKSDNLRKALISAMEAKGLTTEKLAEKLAKGLDAKKTHFSSFQGKIVEERQVDDNETQVKYVRTALEIRGDLQEKNIEINMGLIAIPGNVKDPNQWNQEDTSTQNP